MEADFLDGVEEEIAALEKREQRKHRRSHKAVVVTPPEEAAQRIDEIVEELFVKNLAVIDDAAAFRDVDPGDDEPPPEWVRALGEVEAGKRLRLARAAWLPAKDAPTGFKMAQGFVHSYLKMKAAKEIGGNRTLLVAMVAMPQPVLNTEAAPKLFPVQEVENE
jgi:hypothetical protein